MYCFQHIKTIILKPIKKKYCVLNITYIIISCIVKRIVFNISKLLYYNQSKKNIMFFNISYFLTNKLKIVWYSIFI